MPTTKPAVCDALYISWKLDSEADAAGVVRQVLAEGEDRRLFRLRSWMVARGEARALLVPAVSLEEIADALWKPLPASTRWIEGATECAAVTREIERQPVRMGLAKRPEEWPWSSAFQD